MTLNDDYLALGRRLCTLLGSPAVDGLYLPAPVADETFRDEFGFVFLADGSVGPFYVSLGGMLRTLWRRHPDPPLFSADPLHLLDGFGSTEPAVRGLAVGTFNALSAALMHAAGFEPPDRASDSDGSDDRNGDGDAPVGMVGYFCPLIDRLTARGRHVLVLEQAPQRVPERAGVQVTTDMRALRDCSQVLCTASTLVNDTLPSLLDALHGHVVVDLIGPTGSGLPDPLFAHGVRAVGGIRFASRRQLLEQLRAGQAWGDAGRKYQLDARTYPGVDGLAAGSAQRGADPDQA